MLKFKDVAFIPFERKETPIQEAFHVYLNKFEIVVTHLFFVILCNVDLHKLVWSQETRIHQEYSS